MNIMQQVTAAMYARPLREQMLLAAGSVAIVVMLIWLALVKPINGWRDSAVQTLTRTQEVYAEVNVMAAQLEAARASGNANNSSQQVSMTELIDSSLRKYRLAIRGIQPGQQGEMFVRLEAAPTQSLWQWLYEMEAVQSVKINELTITPTEKEGWVLLTTRLEQVK